MTTDEIISLFYKKRNRISKLKKILNIPYDYDCSRIGKI